MLGRRGTGSALLQAAASWMLALLLVSAHGQARAQSQVRLIMVMETGCRFCMAWERDIGAGYASTPEGRFAPLVRVKKDASEIAGLQPVIYTPTFIVMQDGREVGRVTGYPGKDYFWPELDEILSPLGFVAAP